MNMREMMQLVETAVTAYHVTPTRNLKRIMTTGLVPATGPRSRQLGETEPAVYLFPTLADVETALASWLSDQFSENARLALLAVKVPPEAHRIDAAGFEIAVTSPIPPSDLQVLSRDLLGEIDLTGFQQPF